MRLSGRDFEHTRTHVELCCGRYLSSLIYHLQADRAARALAIDIEEWAVIRDRIPVALRPRILYVQRDVEHLTYDELDKLCHQAFGAHVGLSQVSTVHWSPPCETMSVSLSKRGRRKHRHPDGRAKSATAVKHDSCFENVIGILERLVLLTVLCSCQSRIPAAPASYLSRRCSVSLANLAGALLTAPTTAKTPTAAPMTVTMIGRANQRVSSSMVLSLRLSCRSATTIVPIALCETLAGTVLSCVVGPLILRASM